jgi:Na+/melibiose symporter-like transporter
MIADLSDYRLPDGSKPGEAIYYGLQGLVQKAAIGVVTAAGGILFDLFGNSPERPLGIRLTGPIGALFAIVAVVVMLRYPDDRNGLRSR